MKSYNYYYYDEQNDDFANNGIEQKSIGTDYQYLPKKLWYRILKPVAYYGFLPVFAIMVKCSHVPFINKKVLKNRDKSKGYFIYGNHVSWIPDTVSSAMTAFPKQCYTIANPDAVSIKGAGTLIKMFGAMPTPTDMASYKNLFSAVEKLYNKGCPISIFPEAHIWPKYNKIRKFSAVSFDYPARLHAPCYAKTTVFIKQEDGTTKAKMIFDGPFYADPELKPIQAKRQLCEMVYNAMVKRTEEYDSALDCHYTYTKVDSPDQVRSEIFDLD